MFLQRLRVQSLYKGKTKNLCPVPFTTYPESRVHNDVTGLSHKASEGQQGWNKSILLQEITSFLPQHSSLWMLHTISITNSVQVQNNNNKKKSARTQRHRQTAPINGLCALKLMALIKFAATGRNDNTFGRYATITLAKWVVAITR